MENKDNKCKPVDYIIMILAITISIILIWSVVVHPIIIGAYKEATTKMIVGIITSVIAIISIYVGSKIKK